MSNYQAKLVAEDGDSNDNFGESVAVSGDGLTALVGTPDDEDPNGEEAGSAYVFEKAGGSWTYQTKLAPDDGPSNDSFGISVALSRNGSIALIGAFEGEDSDRENVGSAYVFEKAGGSWSYQAKLTPNDDGSSEDFFGVSVAVSGDGSTALIGAPLAENRNGKEAGSAYVFEKASDSWTQQATLIADDGSSKYSFGTSVAVTSNGSTILIGAKAGRESDAEGPGSAYVFEKIGGSWTQQTELTVDEGGIGLHFRVWVTVAVSGDGSTALIGVITRGDASETGTSTVSIFEKVGGSWTQQTDLAAGDGDGSDFFGYSVAVSNDGSTTLVGAPEGESRHGIFVLSTGSAYVFESGDGSWTHQTKLVADDGDSDDFFGYSVAVPSDGSTGLIGAYKDEDPNGDQAGSAYVFTL